MRWIGVSLVKAFSVWKAGTRANEQARIYEPAWESILAVEKEASKLTMYS
jgi:hypothetical protein